MNKTKIVSGLLSVVLLVQVIVGGGGAVLADETTAITDISFDQISSSFPEISDQIIESDNPLKETMNTTSSEESDELSESQVVKNPLDSNKNTENSVAMEQGNQSTERPDNIIGEGIYGTVPWYITNEDILYLEGGTLEHTEMYENYQSPWYLYREYISEINILDTIIVTSYGAEHLFDQLTSLQTIENLEKMDFSKAKSLEYLFHNTSLINFNASSIDVSNVKSISYMFGGISPGELNLSNWDTSQISDLSGAFSGATIGTLNVENWDMGNASSMRHIFQASNIGEIIGIEQWNTPNLVDSSYAFSYSNLNKLNLSSWVPRRIEYMTEMFQKSKAERIDLSGWDTRNLSFGYRDNINIFQDTEYLKEIILGDDTFFYNETYNHVSKNGNLDSWEDVKTGTLYEDTVSLLTDDTRDSSSFVRKCILQDFSTQHCSDKLHNFAPERFF